VGRIWRHAGGEKNSRRNREWGTRVLRSSRRIEKGRKGTRPEALWPVEGGSTGGGIDGNVAGIRRGSRELRCPGHAEERSQVGPERSESTGSRRGRELTSYDARVPQSSGASG
jgi:hypothetical protein